MASICGFLRPIFHLVKPDPNVRRIFAINILVSDTLQNFGEDGILFLADTGLIPDPTIEDLATIAAETGKLAYHHLHRMVRVAMLSHSNLGSMGDKSARKMQAAAAAANEKIDPMLIDVDGEIHADVALRPEAAKVKAPSLAMKDRADVLVFPSLDAVHISLKLLRHVGGAKGYGKILCGLTRPAALVAPTACEESILGTAAALGVEAIKFHELYPRG